MLRLASRGTRGIGLTAMENRKKGEQAEHMLFNNLVSPPGWPWDMCWTALLSQRGAIASLVSDNLTRVTTCVSP